MISDQDPGPGQLDQRIAWDHFIKRDPYIEEQAWYFDFLIDIPEGDTEGTWGEYLGFIGHGDVHLCIFANGYRLWNDLSQTYGLSEVMATAGRRNIGFHLASGASSGVWIDGAQIFDGGAPYSPIPLLRFGTHKLDNDEPGLILLENLNYVRSFYRGVAPEDSTGGAAHLLGKGIAALVKKMTKKVDDLAKAGKSEAAPVVKGPPIIKDPVVWPPPEADAVAKELANIGALKRAGQVPDRGGLTKAGRALAKHGGRECSVFPKSTGGPVDINRQGQAILDSIMDNIVSTKPNRFGGTDYYGPGGRGARYDGDGKFMGFLEP